MLSSGNDAALALAYAVGGTPEASVFMNEKALARWPCSFCQSSRPVLYNGEHYTSAYDLAIICSEAMKNEVFREIVATKDKKV